MRHIADGCACRTLDTRTLEISDVARACPLTIRVPTGISVRDGRALRAVAVGKSGLVAALGMEGDKVLTLDPQTGRSTLVVHDLPVGCLGKPRQGSGGLAVGSDDTVYVSADQEKAIRQIHRAAAAML